MSDVVSQRCPPRAIQASRRSKLTTRSCARRVAAGASDARTPATSLGTARNRPPSDTRPVAARSPRRRPYALVTIAARPVGHARTRSCDPSDHLNPGHLPVSPGNTDVRSSGDGANTGPGRRPGARPNPSPSSDDTSTERHDALQVIGRLVRGRLAAGTDGKDGPGAAATPQRPPDSYLTPHPINGRLSAT